MKQKVFIPLISAGLLMGALMPVAAGAKTVTLRMLVVGSTGKRLDEQKAVVKDFEQSHPGIKVNLIQTPAGGGWSYYEKYITMVAAGTAPDVMMFGNDVSGRLADTMRPLDDLIKNDRLNLSVYDDNTRQNFTYNDHIIALPVTVDLVTLGYNEDMFKAVGLPAPSKDWKNPAWTWDAFVAVAKKFTLDKNGDGKPDQFGLADSSSGWWTMEIPYIWGTDWFSKGKFVLDEGKAADGFEFWRDMTNRHKIVGGGLQKAAMWFQASWGTVETLQSIKKRFRMDVAAVPTGVKRGTLGYADAIGVPRGVKNVKEAWTLAKYIASSAGSRKWAASVGAQPASMSDDDWYAAQGAAVGVDHSVYVRGRSFVHTPGHFGTKKFQRLDTVINDNLAPFWAGKKSAQQALSSLIPLIKQIWNSK